MVLVDSNVLLEVLSHKNTWTPWSAEALRQYHQTEGLAINALIYAEVSVGYLNPAAADRALADLNSRRLDLPYEAAFLAGKAFVRYKRIEGAKRSPIPDFYIGAHAQVAGLKLLTRDVQRFRTYFPAVQLITPPGA